MQWLISAYSFLRNEDGVISICAAGTIRLSRTRRRQGVAMARFAKEKNTCVRHDRIAAGLDGRAKQRWLCQVGPSLTMILRDLRALTLCKRNIAASRASRLR